MTYKNLFTILGFKLTWIACVLGEVFYGSWIGLFVGFFYLFIFFLFQENKKSSFYIILIFSLAGYIFDSLLSYWNLYIIKADIYFLFLPIWFLVLWPAFGTLLINFFLFLKNKKIISIILGGIMGPISYYSGIYIGLATFQNYLTFILMAVFWSTLMFCYCNYILRRKLL